MNQVALVGNITADPELRYTQSGAALAGFTIAVSHPRWIPSLESLIGCKFDGKGEEQNGSCSGCR